MALCELQSNDGDARFESLDPTFSVYIYVPTIAYHSLGYCVQINYYLRVLSSVI
jgi:hypothetical protein